jgi:integrase/recombinase XerD
MEKVKLSLKLLRGVQMIIIKIPYDQDLIKLVRNIPGVRWDPAERYWFTRNSPEKVEEVFSVFSNKAVLDVSNPHLLRALKNRSLFGQLTSEDEKILYELESLMKEKRYKKSTIENYLSSLRRFLRFTKPKTLEEINEEDMTRYVNQYILPNGLSFNFQNLTVTAVKHLFKNMHKTEFNADNLERPRKQTKLPEILSVEEVARLLSVHSNIKHRLMLRLIYACGLRRSELLNLKPRDINGDREILHIRQSKGNKDRVVRLPPKLLKELREYYKAVRPEIYLFEGQKKGTQYSPTSLMAVLKTALKKAGIKKKFTLHGLRHCYATHLLESGTGIRQIQELLGHKSSKTTEIYTHVSKNSIRNIRSPYEDLDL